MHRLLPLGGRPGWWSPRLSPRLVRWCGPLRRFLLRSQYHIDSVEVQGIEHLKRLLDEDTGVLIAPNHVTYPDPLVVAEAADVVGRPFCYMTAWQVFATSRWIKPWALRRFGCFSVDREGADMRSFRTAVGILMERNSPLVVFPEGEMYHTNDRVMPFHEGSAAILLFAAAKASRAVSCVPAALRYEYVEDPTAQLCALMEELERRFFWRPNAELPPVDRIYRLAEGGLALKELEHLGHTRAGTIPERLDGLCQVVLARLEQQCELEAGQRPVPQRVKAVRRTVLSRLAKLPDEDPQRIPLMHILDEAFFVLQLFSYPGGYLLQRPSIERIAETLDKLEEDVLGVEHARVRGRRRVTLRLGEPLLIEADRRNQPTATELTELLEQRVQGLLDELIDVDGDQDELPIPTGQQYPIALGRQPC